MLDVLSDRMAAVFSLLEDDGADLGPAAAIEAADVLGVDGVWAGLGTGRRGAVLAWGRGEVSLALEDAQFTLGEGPVREAEQGAVPVLVPDVAHLAVRWPAFAEAALGLGVGAVFAFPLRIGAISVGVLTAYRALPGPLEPGQLADALALAAAVTGLLLRAAPTGAVSGSAAPGGGASRATVGREHPATYRAEVHQATGMVSVQLGISLAEALLLLRAHAFGTEHTIGQVAADVVARRLRFGGPAR